MKAQWICYDGDYEMMLAKQCLSKRYERDVFIPPFWRMDNFHTNVKFFVDFTATKNDRIFITASGKFNVILDRKDSPTGKYIYGFDGYADVTPGDYTLTVSVYNDETVPALYVSGETLVSDEKFRVTCNDFEYKNAACCPLTDPACPPTGFNFSYKDLFSVATERSEDWLRADFGRETMAYIRFEGISGKGKAYIFYGESEAESLDTENCELTDVVDFEKMDRTQIAKAFRYVNVRFADGADAERIVAVKEFVPHEMRSSFVCENKLLNEIYKTSIDTLDLTVRDFVLDGIKRDRWIWGGDATQGYLMLYYSFFDIDVIERTIKVLVNREPQKTFINHIMDYSFYWIISLFDYYMYVGKKDVLEKLYPIAESIMAFTQTRKDENGLLVGKSGDWIFIDWANVDNRGEVCAEQLIYLKALKAMIGIGGMLGKDISFYAAEYDSMKEKTDRVFWDKEKNCYAYSVINGIRNKEIKKHPNIFAVYYGLADKERARAIKDNALANDNVEAIVTPYMRFYELSAMAELGETDYVMDKIVSYWGGMIGLGVTSFWEEYNPKVNGDKHYEMYGRKYGKSLCHAWGASPLYLIGRYFVGVSPAAPGYGSFSLRPQRCSLVGDYEATIPVKNGSVHVVMKGDVLTVESDETDGTLYLSAEKYSLAYAQVNGEYVVPVKAGKKYSVKLAGKRTGD